MWTENPTGPPAGSDGVPTVMPMWVRTADCAVKDCHATSK
jgi:hypothetical protein